MTRRRKYWGKKLYKRHIWMTTTSDGKMHKWLLDEMQKMLDQDINRVIVIDKLKLLTPMITIQDIINAKNKIRSDYRDRPKSSVLIEWVDRV